MLSNVVLGIVANPSRMALGWILGKAVRKSSFVVIMEKFGSGPKIC